MDHQSTFHVSEQRPVAIVPRRSLTVQAGWRLALAVTCSTVILSALLIVLGQATWPARAAGAIRYVAPAGQCGPGVSPADCFSSVQAAVTASVNGDEIRVAQGVYTDVTVFGSLTQTVYLSKSLTLRGGYTTTDWAQSLPLARPTVLDAQGANRVIYIAANVMATIEGFTITNGYAANDSGGGIYLDTGGNSAILNNKVYSNVATSSDRGGGGVYIAGGSPMVRGNEIYTNTATDGGGIYVVGGSPTILNNQIHDNRATGSGPDNGGGGIHVRGDSTIIRGNGIYANSANGSSGGGVYVLATGVLIDQNTIHHNSGAYRGGGIYVRDSVNTVQNNLIYSNTLGGLIEGGGGIAYYWGNGIVENNTIYGNTWDGIYTNYNSNPDPVIRNNIVVSNTTYGIRATHAYTVTYNNASGNTTGNYDGVILGAGNMTETPQFESDGVDFRLKAVSLLIDKADPNNFPSNDYDGFARPFGSGPDMGAYEYHTGNCFARLNDGQVYTTVQAAVNAATLSTDTIKVAGVCAGVQTFTEGYPLTQTVYLSKPLTLRGGYTTTNWVSPTTLTVLDPQGQGRGIYITGTSAITVDGFVIRNGEVISADGGGLYIAGNTSPLVQNVIFYSNTATQGGGLALTGGNARLFNNTFVSNTATASNGGGGLYLAGGSPVVNSSLFVGNGHGGVSAADGVGSLAYNDVWGQPGDLDYVGGVTAGPSSLSLDPRFVDPAAFNFHLRYDSPVMHRGDPNTTAAWDVEGDPRPLGQGPDIGADEAALYPNVTLGASPANDVHGIVGRSYVFTHTLLNDGTLVSDTYRLSHLLTVSGPPSGWSVSYDTRDITLMRNESRQVLVTVTVGGGISGTVAYVDLWATSQMNTSVYDTKQDRVLLNLTAGLQFTPTTVLQNVNPGAVYTFAHTLQNTGNYTENVTFAWYRDPSESANGIAINLVPPPTSTVPVGPFTQTTVWVGMSIPATLPGGITQTVVMTAYSSISPTLYSVFTDSILVNYTAGPRYVAAILPQATDTLNNCHVANQPCRTIQHAVEQAANGDEVRVARGVYNEGAEISVNKNITLTGGYDVDFDARKWNPIYYPTILDGQNRWRVFNIFGSPTVQGFTIQNGKTSGSGGGVFINLGAPTLRQNVIRNNEASQFGGGIYVGNLLGAAETPRLERNELFGNQALRGGGLASKDVNTVIWNNLVYQNTATEAGGGVYVDSGRPLIWHDTIFGNTAVITGGGVCLNGGTPVVSNTIIASNTAAIAGGVYSQAAGASLDYNDVWSNANDPSPQSSAGPHGLLIDPSFVSVVQPDLHLQVTSPLTNTAQPSIVNEDYWGNPRPLDAGPEIGADEIMVVKPVLSPGRAVSAFPGEVLTFTHVLTNQGNYPDLYTLVAESNLGWTVTYTPPFTVPLGVLQSSPVTVVVTLPPTATAYSTSTILLRATSGNEMAIWATAVNTVTVLRTIAVTLTPDLELLGSWGSPVRFTHFLTNAGNYTDTFAFSFRSISTTWPSGYNPATWSTSVPGPVTLGPFTGTLVSVVVTPTGGNATYPPVYVDTVFITATSQFSPTVSDTVSDTAYVNRTIGVNIEPNLVGTGTPPTYGAYPHSGNPAQYTHILTNTGNYTDTFILTPTSSLGWDILGAISVSPRVVTLAANKSQPIDVVISIPHGTYSGTVDHTTVLAASRFDPTIHDSVVDTTTVGWVADLTLGPYWPPAAGYCIDAQPDRDVTASYWFQLTNAGNLYDTFDLDVLNDSSPGDTVPASFNKWSFSPPVITATRSLLGNTFTYVAVYVQVGSEYYGHLPFDRTVTMDATSQADSNATTIAAPPFVTRVNWDNNIAWEGPTSVSTLAGRTFEFTRTLRLTGTKGTGVDLKAVSEHNWTVNITPTGSLVSHDDVITVKVGLQVPRDTTVASDTVTLIADTTTTCLREEAADTTVWIDNVVLSPDNATFLGPGTLYTYTHNLTSVGLGTDNYSITVKDTLGWMRSFSPTDVLNIAPGDSVSVTAVVQVPLTGPQSFSDTVDVMVITATSTSRHGVSPDVLFDTAVDTTTVKYVPSALLTPDRSGSLSPGEVTTYTHSLTNTGNYTDTFNLTAHPSDFGYAGIITPAVSAVQLAPGQTLSGIQVQVVIKGDAPGGETDDTSVIASFANTQVVAHDKTSITGLAGPRFVAGGGSDTNNNCMAPIQTGPCATLPHALIQAMSGDTIYAAQGVYTGTLVVNKSVTLTGGYNVSNWSATPNPWLYSSIMDGQGQGRVVSITGGIAATLAGFKIMNGSVFGNGAGVYVNTTRPVTLSANIIYNNIATGNGGGVYVPPGGDLKLYNSILHSNTAYNGGGVYAGGSAATMNDDTLAANRATNTGGALYQAAGTTTVANTILANNTAGTGNGGAFYQGGGNPLTFSYCDVFGNTGSNSPGGIGNISVDPLFKDSASGDYHLSIASPLINSVSSGLGTDVDYDARPALIPNERTSTPYDIGADEYAWIRKWTFAPSPQSRTTIYGPVVYTHTLTNTGTWTDTISLAAGIDQGWTVQVLPTSLTSFAPGQSTLVTVTVNWPPTPLIGTVATARITATSTYGPDPVGSATDTTVYQTAAALTIGKETTPANPVAGAPFTYTLTVVNSGSDLATNLVVTDAVPSGANYVSAVGGSLLGGIVTWNAGSLSAGSSTQVALVVNACQAVTNNSYRVSGDGGLSAVGTPLNTTVVSPTITPDFARSAAVVNQTVWFTASTTTNGGPIVSWTWNWGDGQPTSTGATASHQFAATMDYTVVLTVQDNCGNSQSASHLVHVSDMPGTLDHFVIGPIAQQYVDTDFTFVITAYDSLGAVIPSYNGQLALVDSSGTLLPATWSTWVNGVATPLARVRTPFTGDVITATASGVSAHSNLFDVVWNPAGTVALDVSPTTIAVGATAHVTATVLNAGGNPVDDSTQVTFAATLGTIAPQVATTTNGRATAVFTGMTAGTSVLTATASTGPHGNATVTVVQAGQLDHFVIGPVAQQYVGAGFALVVTAYDGTGNVLTSFNGSLALADSTGTLLPTAWSTWVNGVATPSVRVQTPFTGDVITATASGVSAHSNSFDVVRNPLGSVDLVSSASAIGVGWRAYLTATAWIGGSLAPDGTPITFTTSLGTIAPQVTTVVGGNGKAYAVFTGTTAGTALITATLSSGTPGNVVIAVRGVYLPLVMRNYAPPIKNLTVSAINASTNPANVSVVIQNAGNVAITEDFYVILYLDPTKTVQINKFWWDVGCTMCGAAWQVTTDMQPGQTLTLLPANATPPYKGYWPTSFSSGQHSLWAQVDAYGSGTTGVVQETNESDNIRGPVRFTK